MCNKQNFLALESAARYIAQCEHGTIHIVWDNLTVRLRPADFARFTATVQDAFRRMRDQAGPGRFRLTIKDVVLSFSLTDLTVLRELACLAAIGLGRVEEGDDIILPDPVSIETYSYPGDPPSFYLN